MVWRKLVHFLAFNYAFGIEMQALLSAIKSLTYCKLYECCGPDWIYFNETALQTNLRSGLHGQHLVADIVPKHLKFHMTHNPSKALALSFHGGPGTGKNYVSRIIAESIFKKGMGSKIG